MAHFATLLHGSLLDVQAELEYGNCTSDELGAALCNVIQQVLALSVATTAAQRAALAVPTQQAPAVALTDEQIDAIADSVPNGYTWWRDFARALLTAAGIGGGK